MSLWFGTDLHFLLLLFALAADDLLVALFCQKHMPKGAVPTHRRPQEGGHGRSPREGGHREVRPPGIMCNPGGGGRGTGLQNFSQGSEQECTKPRGGLEVEVLGGDGDRRRSQSCVPRHLALCQGFPMRSHPKHQECVCVCVHTCQADARGNTGDIWLRKSYCRSGNSGGVHRQC